MAGSIDVTAVAGIIIGFGATASAMALPLKFPNAPKWVLEASWWGGILLMLAGVGGLLYEYLELTKVSPTTLIIIGFAGALLSLCIAATGAILLLRSPKHSQPENVSKPSAAALSFAFVGSSPTRVLHIGQVLEGQTTFATEELRVRLVAKENLRNVRSILVRVRDLNSIPKVNRDFDYVNVFSGNLPRGMQADLVLYRQKYQMVQAAEINGGEALRPYFHHYRFIESRLFPSTADEIETTNIPMWSPFMEFSIKVIHEDGPSEVTFQTRFSREWGRSEITTTNGPIEVVTDNRVLR